MMRSVPLYLAAAMAAYTGLHPAVASRLSAVEASLASLREQVTDLNESAATISDRVRLQAQLDELRTELDSAEQSHDDVFDAVYTLGNMVADLDAQTVWMERWTETLGSALNLVSDEQTFVVHTQDEFRDALVQIDRMDFRSDGSAVIQIASPGFAMSSIRIDHPQAEHISIIGDPADRERVQLTFRGSGIIVEAGARLGMLDGLVLEGEGDGVGITVEGGSSATLGASVTVRRFSEGISVRDDSALRVEGGCSTDLHAQPLSELNRGHGIDVIGASFLMANRCVVEGNGLSGVRVSGNSFAAMSNGAAFGNDQNGILVERDSYMNAQDFETANNGEMGALATTNSTIVADRMHSHGNGESGISSTFGSVFMHERGISSDNGLHGMHAGSGAYIRAGDAATGNLHNGIDLDVGSTLWGNTIDVAGNGSHEISMTGNSEMVVEGLHNSGGARLVEASHFGTW